MLSLGGNYLFACDTLTNKVGYAKRKDTSYKIVFVNFRRIDVLPIT